MIHIQKGFEPRSLRDHRNTPGADFDSLDKTETRKCLLQEQGYLCAYCMKRIRNASDVKIEHYVARNSENELVYTNLLAVCDGNNNTKDEMGKVNKDRFTCDSMKKNHPLHINPQKKSDMETIYYDNQGKIYSRNAIYEEDLNHILNLNDEYGYLIANRKDAINVIMNKLRELKPGQDAMPLLNRLKSKYESKNEKGEYEEYLGIIRWYIEKHIRKHVRKS